jgi:acetyl esterase/lipase
VPNADVEVVWFGNKQKAKTILLYIPGGGFVMPTVPGMVNMVDGWQHWVGDDLAICAPMYALSPGAAYPQALAETVEALRSVLDGIGKDKDVLLGGDSAGGQLALAILSHIGGHGHPRKSVKQLDLGRRKLKGASPFRLG